MANPSVPSLPRVTEVVELRQLLERRRERQALAEQQAKEARVLSEGNAAEDQTSADVVAAVVHMIAEEPWRFAVRFLNQEQRVADLTTEVEALREMLMDTRRWIGNVSSNVPV